MGVTTDTGAVPAEERLRDIQVIADAELSRLDERDFLAELLDRVRATLPADTAAVLLLDSRSGELAAAAAAGLEEEVAQGVRIPVGWGFAGRIAASGAPVILDQIDHTAELNPIWREKGIQSLIGVPMVAGGRVLGVLHAGSLTPRQFTAQDAELLQLAAERAAVAVQSLGARADRAAVTALQRSLVPPAPPVIDGIEMAARYVPGHGVVGGDWYDVFTLPTGQLGLVMGDVAGSGLPAAVIMGRIRSALRAYALDCADPAEVLARLDRKMQHFEPTALATVLYAVTTPGLDQIRVSSAGHLPPITAAPGQPAHLADVTPDPMIGLAPGMPRRAVTLALPPGGLFCLYTDGLVERHNEPLDDSLDRLRQAVTAQPPHAACHAVMNALVGHQPARDDIALLIARRPPAAAPR